MEYEFKIGDRVKLDYLDEHIDCYINYVNCDDDDVTISDAIGRNQMMTMRRK